MAELVRWTKKKQRIGRDWRLLMQLGTPLAVVASAGITERKLRTIKVYAFWRSY